MKFCFSLLFCLLLQNSSVYCQYTPTFVAKPMFGEGASRDCSWGDFDLDGDKDLLVANYDSILLFVNYGEFIFQKLIITVDTFDINFAKWFDLNNDNYPEIIIGYRSKILNKNAPCYLFINNKNGTFTKQILLNEVDASDASCGDIDSDSDTDIILGIWEHDINLVLLNQGNFSFNLDYSQDNIEGGVLVHLADVDRDGDLDLINAVGCCVGEKKIYKNDGSGKFSEFSIFATPISDFMNLDTADFDNDGDVDFICGNFEQDILLNIYKNDGVGNFSPFFIDTSMYSEVIFDDIDNDEDQDIVLCSFGILPGKLIIYLNQNGNFIKYVVEKSDSNFTFPVTNAIFSIDIYDANNDGHKDIAAARFNWEEEFLFTPQQNTLFVFDSTTTGFIEKDWNSIREENSFLQINPLQGNSLHLRFYLPDPGKVLFQIFDITSKKITEFNLGTYEKGIHEKRIIINRLSVSGIYVGRLINFSSGKFTTEKFQYDN